MMAEVGGHRANVSVVHFALPGVFQQKQRGLAGACGMNATAKDRHLSSTLSSPASENEMSTTKAFCIF